jgi:CelD/BcsL family acetyltransferase involved in cellulose biosynthesis
VGARLVDDLDELRSAAAAWDGLAVAARRPYAAPAWALAWWEHMRPASARLSAVLVEDGGELIGIAPFYADGRDLRLLAGDFAGNVEPLAARGRETEVARAVAAVIGAGDPRMVVLSQQGADPDWPELLIGVWPGGRGPQRQPGRGDPCPYVTLDGPDLDGWMASKSGSFRRDIRRHRKRLDEAGGSIRAATAETLERDVSELLRLHRERLADRGTLLSEDGNQPALVAAGRELLAAGRFRLLSMEIDGVTVGSQLLVAAGGEVCAWNSGFDEAYAKQSPIMQLLIHALEDAIERGERRLSLGPGGQEYKSRLADGDDELVSCTLIPHGRGYLRGRLRKGLRSRAAAVRHRFG